MLFSKYTHQFKYDDFSKSISTKSKISSLSAIVFLSALILGSVVAMPYQQAFAATPGPFVVTFTVDSGSQITLNWTTPTDGGFPPLKVQIQRNLNGAGFLPLLGTPTVPFQSTYTDNTLTLGDSVRYLVRVCNSNGSPGEFSTQVTAPIVTFDPAPSATPVAVSGGGSGCDDCSPPTLGYDSFGKKLVDNGFTYNGQATDAKLFFTPFPLITVEIGKENIAELKIYDDSGPEKIQHVSLGFGLATGEYMSQSNAVINYDIDFQGNGVVSQDDPENAIDDDTLRVLTEKVKCTDSSNDERCLLVTIFHTFRAPLEFNIVGTDIWDSKRNTWQNLFNHGIHIVGDSMNPPKEYDGIFKGKIFHLFETSKTTAVDESGNNWTLKYGIWNMDYIPIVKSDPEFINGDKVWSINHVNEKSSQTLSDVSEYDRNHSKFAQVKDGQILIAESLMKELCPDCLDEPYDKINNIIYYKISDNKKILYKNQLGDKLNFEANKASKLLSEIFERQYPDIVQD